MSVIEKIALKDLLPNPFRNIEHYTIPEEKIAALIRSFETTGVWPTVIVRKVANRIEKAFGHARTAAAERLYGRDHKIEVVVMDLSDEQMLRMMADENGELWGSHFLVDMETVDAVIKAHAAGKIHLESRARAGTTPDMITVARFLNWVQPNGIEPQERVEIALKALKLIKEGILKISQFENLSNRHARALVEEARITEKRISSNVEANKEEIAEMEKEIRRARTPVEREQAEKKKFDLQRKTDELANLPAKVGEAVSSAMKTGKVGYRQARKVTDAITDNKVFKPVPLSEDFIANLCRSLSAILSPYSDKERMEKIQAVIDAKDVLTKEQVQRVAGILVEISGICLDLAAKLNTNTMPARNRVKALK